MLIPPPPLPPGTHITTPVRSPRPCPCRRTRPEHPLAGDSRAAKACALTLRALYMLPLILFVLCLILFVLCVLAQRSAGTHAC